jgi:AraC family transcriptional regulator
MHQVGKLDGIDLMQADGTAPAVFASGQAPGENGVAILGMRFSGGARFRATAQQHLVFFQAGACATEFQPHMECRMDRRRLRHAPPLGSLAICPAGTEGVAEADYGFDCIMVAIDPKQFALAAAEGATPEASLIERLSGHDVPLLGLARRLVAESGAGYPNGPLLWNDLAADFIGGLAERHAAAPVLRARGQLSGAHLKRIRDYILVHLEQPIEVAALAGIAGRSPFHFSRVFSRTVGMTPHRYVVHLRLRRALEMVRAGNAGLAEIAAATGFADQSHLWRWVRRVYGVPLTRLSAPPPPAEPHAKQQESSRPAGSLFSD